MTLTTQITVPTLGGTRIQVAAHVCGDFAINPKIEPGEPKAHAVTAMGSSLAIFTFRTRRHAEMALPKIRAALPVALLREKTESKAHALAQKWAKSNPRDYARLRALRGRV